MGRIYEPLLVPKPIRILRSTCTSLSDARGASERFKSVGEAQPTEKGMPTAYPFLLGCVSDLDAKPCVADLDAREVCRGYTNPLAMVGVERFRDLSDF